MYYVTIFVEKTFIACLVAMIKERKTVLVAKETFDADDSVNNLCLFINKTIPQRKRKMVCRIILTPNSVIQRSLQLPNLHLMPYEIDAYVKNSLAKIFHTNEKLVYDYISDTSEQDPNKKQQLIVYVCQYDLLNDYLVNTKRWNINFIGVPEFSSQNNSSAVTEGGIENELNRISCAINLNGINFLPWREREKEKRRKYFLLTTAGYLLVLIAMTIFLIYFVTLKLNQQIAKNEILQSQHSQTTTQLSSLIDIDKQNKQLQQILNEQEVLNKQITTILQYLALISTAIPKNVWLVSLEYKENIIKLKGQSFLYSDVLSFSEELDQHHLVQNSKVISVKRDTSLFSFNIHIHFIQNEQ